MKEWRKDWFALIWLNFMLHFWLELTTWIMYIILIDYVQYCCIGWRHLWNFDLTKLYSTSTSANGLTETLVLLGLLRSDVGEVGDGGKGSCVFLGLGVVCLKRPHWWLSCSQIPYGSAKFCMATSPSNMQKPSSVRTSLPQQQQQYKPDKNLQTQTSQCLPNQVILKQAHSQVLLPCKVV